MIDCGMLGLRTLEPFDFGFASLSHYRWARTSLVLSEISLRLSP
jgi:hypothetical protein